MDGKDMNEAKLLASAVWETRRRHPIYRAALAVFLTCSLLLLVRPHLTFSFVSTDAYHRFMDPSAHYVQSQSFNWSSLNPSRDLVYYPCGDGFECARLLVPLDWAAAPETQWDHTVAIAILRQRANVSLLDQRYGGEVFFNPGGPGASGVRFLQIAADELRSIVDGPPSDPKGKVFDLVAFDPRGMGYSTPRVSCFDDEGDPLARQVWGQIGSALPLVDGPEEAFRMRWARAQAQGMRCGGGDESDEMQGIKGFVGTTSVARDLVEILERGGELRERTAQMELSNTIHPDDKAPKEVPETLKYRKGEETLQYWGFSYGTTLGGYFASMYPQRVKRMILDGSNNFDDWSTREDMHFIDDTDATFDYIFTSCFFAGAARCPLYDSEGPVAIRTKVTGFIANLTSTPLAVWEPGMQVPNILTQDILLLNIDTQLLSPYSTFPTLASDLAGLLSGNTSAARKFLLPGKISCLDKPAAVPAWIPEGRNAVMCTDGPDLRNGTLDDFRAWEQRLSNTSKLFVGATASEGHLDCYFWPVRPTWRFTGPFGGKTRHPILWIGTRADPVCPLANAVEMAGRFEAAEVLVQKSARHTSLSAPCTCSMRVARAYFQRGEMPKVGTRCEVDRGIFDATEGVLEGLGENDRVLRGAVEKLAMQRLFGR
ncbi:TAP-like protein-domain-containing protein [Xylariales sp. AK1849]|nr:TAP-like protein-domain-containing protein [Xylariales sp. AK1849]